MRGGGGMLLYVKSAVSFLLSYLVCHWMPLQVGSQTPFLTPTVVKLSHLQTVLEADQVISQQLGGNIGRKKELIIAL